MMGSAVLMGLAAGMVHVLSGPDHLAAIAPLSVGKRRGGWAVGMRWGIGHSVGVLLIGFLSLTARGVFQGRLALPALSDWAERAVGITLIGIGLWGLRNVLRRRVHTHDHVHEGHSHAHFHFHGPRTAHEPGCGPAEAGTTNGQGRVVRSHRHGHAATEIGS